MLQRPLSHYWTSPLTKIALPYLLCGLSIANFIPGILGRFCCWPLWVSCRHKTMQLLSKQSFPISCCFAGESPSVLMDITVIVRPEEDESFRRQLVETIVVWLSRCGCSRYPVDDGGGRISSELSPGRCPVSSPATWTLLPWDPFIPWDPFEHQYTTQTSKFNIFFISIFHNVK